MAEIDNMLILVGIHRQVGGEGGVHGGGDLVYRRSISGSRTGRISGKPVVP